MNWRELGESEPSGGPLSLVQKFLKSAQPLFAMVLNNYDWIVASKQRDRLITEVITKPKTPLEMQFGLGLKKNNKLTLTIHQMVDRDVMRPLAKGIYGLPEEGKAIKKKRCVKTGKPYSYTEVPGVDWKAYAWLMKGKQRVKLIRVLDSDLTSASQIIRKAKGMYPITQRAFETLRDFVKKGLAKRVRRTRFLSSYALNKRGGRIQHQFLLIWAMLFMFY